MHENAEASVAATRKGFLAPGGLDRLTSLGEQGLNQRLGRWTDAVRRPTPAAISLALGSAHFRAGNVAEAEAHFLEAVAVDPKLGEAHNNLAVIYMLAGSIEEARERVALAEKSGLTVNHRLKAALDPGGSRSAGAP